MDKRHLPVVLAIAFALMVSPTACKKDRNVGLGSVDNPIKIAFMPAPDKGIMEENTATIAKEMEKFSGLSVEPIIARNFISIIDGLASKKMDVAFTNSLGYLLARDWGKAEAALQIRGVDGKMVYKTAIITRKDSGIKSLEDLNGKGFAYTDPYSMSGYLMPLYMFTEKGIKPTSTLFAGGYSEVVEGVYNGGVDAGAIYYCERDPYGRINDAREKLIPKYSDMLDKVIVIALSEPIPTTPIVFRRGLPEDVKTKLVQAFKRLGNDPKGIAAVGKLYGATGFEHADEESYNQIREILKKLGKEAQEVVPGGVTFYRKHLWDYAPEY